MDYASAMAKAKVGCFVRRKDWDDDTLAVVWAHPWSAWGVPVIGSLSMGPTAYRPTFKDGAATDWQEVTFSITEPSQPAKTLKSASTRELAEALFARGEGALVAAADPVGQNFDKARTMLGACLGRPIQSRSKLTLGGWQTIISGPDWNWSDQDYRVAPGKPKTGKCSTLCGRYPCVCFPVVRTDDAGNNIPVGVRG